MSPDEQQSMVRFIRDTEQAIALALFRSIIPEAHYILIPDKSAERFNYQRIMEGLPVGLVVDLVSMVERPIRSGEFYMLSEDPQDGEIHEGYGQMLATSETGILKTGSELTVGEVWRAAQVFVQAKLEGLQDG